MLTNGMRRDNLITKRDALVSQLTLNDIQLLLFQVVQAGQNVFITGSAGCGKSFLSEAIKKTLSNLVVLGPTGMSALNVGGQTIHSFFSLPIGYLDPVEFLAKLNKKKLGALKHLKHLLIDEISMVRADTLDNIDLMLRKVRNSKKPFGGVQIILVGDFCQLEPIIQKFEEKIAIKAIYGDNPYAFNAHSWASSGIISMSLINSERTTEHEYQRCMRNIRTGRKLASSIYALNQMVSHGDAPVGSLRLCTTNEQVDKYNSEGLKGVRGLSTFYSAVIKGKIDIKSCIAEEVLQVKVGCRVMTIANSPGKYVNGDLGVVTAVGGNYVMVQLDRGGVVKVMEYVWKQIKYKVGKSAETKEEVFVPEEDGSIKQIPLKLAYGLTIHKAQGQTIDSATLDLTKGTFGCGQAYVGLSRMRSAKSLYLATPLDETQVLFNEEAVQFSIDVGYETLALIPELREKYDVEALRSDLAKAIDKLDIEIDEIEVESPLEKRAIASQHVNELLRRCEITLQVGIIAFTQILNRNNIAIDVKFKKGCIVNAEFIMDDGVRVKWKDLEKDETFPEYLERNDVDTQDYPRDFISKINAFSNDVAAESIKKEEHRKSLLSQFLASSL
ncbi:DEAD/DEAH box helicase [Vibrio splendidus]|nr:AAA family ATPase [Vibrio splendidus]MCC4880368.1 AAA family ATPase [Vibrio splendidus]